MAPSGASTRTTRSRIAEAKPASSSTVSPRIRSAHEQRRQLGRRSLAIHDRAHRLACLVEVERPALDDRREGGSDVVAHRAAPALGHPRRRERAARIVEDGRLTLTREPEEVGEQVRALGREHALGVELDALEGQRNVANAHDHPVDLG